MKTKSVCMRVIALLLIAMLVFAGCRSQGSSLEESKPSQAATEPTTTVAEVPQEIVDALSKFHQHLQDGTLRLTIYYDDYFRLYQYPVSQERLMTFSHIEIINVEDDELQEHKEGFAEFQVGILVPPEEECYQSTHMCYVFETEDEGTILTVASNLGFSESYFINGFEVQYNVVFYDMIRPFLTEDITALIDPIYYWQPGQSVEFPYPIGD